MFLPFGWHGCSAAWVHLSGRAYRECEFPYNSRVHLSGRAYRECEFPYNSRVLRGTGRTCTKPMKNHMICAFLRPLQGGKNQKKRSFTGRPSHKQTNKHEQHKHTHTKHTYTNPQAESKTREQASKHTQTTKQKPEHIREQTNKQKTQK